MVFVGNDCKKFVQAYGLKSKMLQQVQVLAKALGRHKGVGAHLMIAQDWDCCPKDMLEKI